MESINLTQPIPFNARWCNVCPLFRLDQEISVKLYKCCGCRLVQYCSVQHQRIDWPLHKEFCRATQSIMKAYMVPHIFAIDKESLENRVLQVKLLLRYELKRVLYDNEEQITSYPDLCAVCFKTRNLKVCPDCQGVSYCSEECKQTDEKHHGDICRELRLFYCSYKFKISNQPVIYDLLYHVPLLHKTTLINALQCATKRHISDEPYKSLDEFQLFSDMANFSCIGTICYALERMQMTCLGGTKFVIFIIGAEEEPNLYFAKVHTKFFFLQYPQITTLELHFIGPNLCKINKHEFVYNFQGQRRIVNSNGYKGLFQEFCQQYKANPSIIISFNCGFSEHTHRNETLDIFKESSDLSNPSKVVANPTTPDTWPQGIFQIIQTYQVPIVFTSFTLMEAKFDYGALAEAANFDNLSTRIDRIFSIHQNPFRDPRAMRNIVTDNDEEIYYRNGYIQALWTRVSS